jgi:hypothetical protein
VNYQSGKTQQLALGTMSGTTVGKLAGAGDAVGSAISGTADLAWTGIKAIWDPTARGEISANFDALGHVISTPSQWQYLAGALTPSQREQLAKDYESGNGYAASKALGEQGANILMTVLPGSDAARSAAVLNDGAKIGKTVEDVGSSATKGTATRLAEQRGWKPATELTISQANKLLDQSLPSGVKIDNIGSADTVNASARLKGYDDPLIAGTNVVDVTATQSTHFVRVFSEGSKSEQAGSWVMRADDVAGLTPSQIASKYSLPQIPDMITEVTIPAGTKMQVSVANNILKGTNGGGGGVQFQLQIPTRDLPPEWFTNPRQLK